MIAIIGVCISKSENILYMITDKAYDTSALAYLCSDISKTFTSPRKLKARFESLDCSFLTRMGGADSPPGLKITCVRGKFIFDAILYHFISRFGRVRAQMGAVCVCVA